MTQPQDETPAPEAGEQPEAQDTTAEAPSSEEGAPAGAEADAQLDSDLETATADAARAQEDVAALTGDLQRLQAEFLNYKRRVERDRQLVAENAAYKALTPVIEVLDGIDRAREAGEVEGGFAMVADHLQRAVAQSGLVRFGEPGDVFDPNLHEALSHLGEDADVTETSVKVVAKAGYKMGERVVRAAMVLTVDPPAGGAPAAAEPPADGGAAPDA
ncbi:nucleotide exchange factor GrpE [Nocardioides solisilvae]|uniref:nucleotide exchange factor GrpE n=1 Tax=Nocardioides solisilvae TaxID=1542435 RepID=UPI000D74A5EC|nr:nucleotide exchange factor GrpE [Nocardioides solisilvae]